jgi:hypothetical protein
MTLFMHTPFCWKGDVGFLWHFPPTVQLWADKDEKASSIFQT